MGLTLKNLYHGPRGVSRPHPPQSDIAVYTLSFYIVYYKDKHHLSISMNTMLSTNSTVYSHCFLKTFDSKSASFYSCFVAGRSYSVMSQRSLIQCLESLVQKVQGGVVIHFEKMGPDPPPVTENNTNGKMNGTDGDPSSKGKYVTIANSVY